MQANLRKTFQATKCCVRKDLERRFGLPVTLQYGDRAAVGAAQDEHGNPLFANAGHIHGFPAAVDTYLDGLTNQLSFHTDILPRLPNGCASSGARTGAHLDGAGLQAAFGAEALTVGSAENFMLFGNHTGALDTSARVHHPRRTRRFTCRVKPTAAVPENPMATFPTLKRAIVGCFRTSTTLDLTTLTDGIYFYIELGSTGLGNWRAVCMADGVSEEVELPASLDVVPTPGGYLGNFQIFNIAYDGEAAIFQLLTGIGTTTVRLLEARIASHVPTAFIAGWGTGCAQISPGNTQPQSWTYDGFTFVGHRHL